MALVLQACFNDTGAKPMKPRARWLSRFTSWFFNTSPEWVASHESERHTRKTQQESPSGRPPGDSPGSEQETDPQPRREK
jgi:hypothetical protein